MGTSCGTTDIKVLGIVELSCLNCIEVDMEDTNEVDPESKDLIEVEFSEDVPMDDDDENDVDNDEFDDLENSIAVGADLSNFTFPGHQDSVYCAAVNSKVPGQFLTGIIPFITSEVVEYAFMCTFYRWWRRRCLFMEFRV